MCIRDSLDGDERRRLIFLIDTAIRRHLPLNFFMERYTESYVVEMQAFVDAVRGDTPVPATGEDARAATALALAAMQSYADNRPVRL